jgi:hypothetical protein
MNSSTTETTPGAATAHSSAKPAVPLDYGHEDHVGDFSRRVSAGAAERFDGFFQFIGMIIAMIGGLRQIIFAVGLGLFVEGLGEVIARNPDAVGLHVMAIGAGLIGLCIPLRKSKA